ncbi:MAG: ATP-binding cassette domain-containing protein [Pseudomonadota bacterium]
MLRLDRVTFQHGSDGPRFEFSIQAAGGTITSVMGPSGSGKSTLLDLISGFLRATSGDMRWEETSFGDKRPDARPVTILFQKNAVFDHLTVETNLAFGLDPRGKLSTSNRERIAQALRSVGLPDLETRKVRTLSGGQQQRVALARSLLRDRPILLLDEPFNGLDDETREVMHSLVGQAAADGKCVILVTHDRADAEALNSRILHVNDGRLHPE